LRIAGGLIVSFLGFRMLFPEAAPALSPSGRAAALQKEDISFMPLAMPLLSGPGSIAVVIGLSSVVEHESGVRRLSGYALIAVGIALTAFICWLVLRAATRLNALLGSHGITAMTRIMGFLLICIGVQFVINGVLDIAARG
jgi:multiple antibiotic resistance protein